MTRPAGSGDVTNTPPAYRQPFSVVAADLKCDLSTGLMADAARERLLRLGKNELPVVPPVPAWRRLVAQFTNPLTILLLVAIVISLIAWLLERDTAVPFEAITILAIVIINAVLGYVQEARAEQAIAALRAMSAATTRVLRDGQQHIIATAEVVPGDVVLLEEGDTIPADGRVTDSISLRVAEAVLTGESTPVSKDAEPIEEEVGIADQANMVWSGTSVIAGRGRVLVTATGARTELGKIASTLQETEEGETPLQQELDRTGRLLGGIVIAIAIFISGMILIVEHIRTLTELVDVLILAVSLAVAAVPEGLTAITTIVLSLGMQRMARRNVIVRKLAAVETLGSTTVICSDKTGTLTKNEMTVRVAVTAEDRWDLAGTGYEPVGDISRNGEVVADPVSHEDLRLLLGAAGLANNAILKHHEGVWTIQGDPTEGALLVAAQKIGLTSDDRDARFVRVGEIPFSSERKLMSTAYTDAEQDQRVILASKGAPDILLARCMYEHVANDERPLTDERRESIRTVVDQLAADAFRTIGVAYRQFQPDATPDDLSDQVEQEFVWLGLVGMIDPPRSEATDAVQLARQAGIRAIMITGDHPKTAAAIATELGIINAGDRAMTGAELQHTDEADLKTIVSSTSVYARVAPEHKLQIVRALRSNNEIVAMTGDGVNDAPALKAADIGIAMGITGTDVSKGAADMILTDDNFASIVAAIEEGRSIFANIQKFLRYLLSSNVGEVFVMFFGVLLADQIGLVPENGSRIVVPLLATQILWINLLTDSGPALALGVEPADHGVMYAPPRDPGTRIIHGRMWVDIVLIGIVMAIATLLVMDWGLPGGLIANESGSMAYAQTLAFCTLVLAQLFNAFNARFERRSAFNHLGRNRWLWVAVLVSLLLQIAVVYLPFLQAPFRTVALSATDWLLCFVAGASVLAFGELKKLVARWIRANRAGAGPAAQAV